MDTSLITSRSSILLQSCNLIATKLFYLIGQQFQLVYHWVSIMRSLFNKYTLRKNDSKYNQERFFSQRSTWTLKKF